MSQTLMWERRTSDGVDTLTVRPGEAGQGGVVWLRFGQQADGSQRNFDVPVERDELMEALSSESSTVSTLSVAGGAQLAIAVLRDAVTLEYAMSFRGDTRRVALQVPSAELKAALSSH